MSRSIGSVGLGMTWLNRELTMFPVLLSLMCTPSTRHAAHTTHHPRDNSTSHRAMWAAGTPFREGGHNSNNGAIPSIWMNADGPKTPPERTNSLTRAGSKGKAAYQRLRTLTKRYSMPFPIFTSKSEGSAGEGTTSRSSGLGRSLTTRTTSRGVFSGSMSDVKEEPEREREALWIKPSTSARSG